MHVLHVYNRHRGFGGSDRATEATIQALRRHGVEVDEFVRDSRDLAPGLAGKLAAFSGGLYAASAVREFTQTLRRRRPDIVHVHELYPMISPWVLPRCSEAGVPVVMTCNDFRLSCPVATHYSQGQACFRCAGGREYWGVLRNCRGSLAESTAYALRNASARHFGLFDRHVRRYVAISRYQREHLIDQLGLDAARVELIHCAIDLPAEPVADPAAGSYVGFAGRFVAEKGVEVMVQACRLAGLPMRLAGDADHHPAVRDDDDAAFVMTRSPADLADFYRGARIIVVPSTWPETFGIVAAEAMGHGVPVIVSRIGGLQGSVRDGETGLLAEPGDAQDLADKLRRVWDDASLARRLGAGARRHALAEFSVQTHCERLMRVYRGVAAGAVPAAGAMQVEHTGHSGRGTV
jgi:glycosyltransferase involved in cell wall biosynthesis